VNDIGNSVSDTMTDERPPKGGERHIDAAKALLNLENISSRQSSIATQRLTVAIILVFWLVLFASFTAYRLLMWPGENMLLMPRAIICAGGALISFGIVAAQQRLRRHRLAVRAAAALGLAIVGAMLHALVNHGVFLAFIPGYPSGDSPLWMSFAVQFLDRWWVFLSLSAIILALIYSADIRDRETQIHALQSLAQSAQIRALRYQLNPHFLFNALNSIAGLMTRHRVAEAEAMTVSLADFLRMSLALDPQSTIPLDKEVHLQRLYLDIEKVRFPERLRTHVDIAPDAEQALVPSLITQPLIENSLKYAVARSTEPVDLSISATAANGCLEILIEDSGGNAEHGPVSGAHLGLSNVAERLRAHYGKGAQIQSSPKEGGGFSNLIRLPFEKA
jgi:two-component system, LytTR family, sensor kinase